MSETAEQIDDGIDVMDMTDEEFEAYVGGMDEKLKDNYDNDGDEAEYDDRAQVVGPVEVNHLVKEPTEPDGYWTVLL